MKKDSLNILVIDDDPVIRNLLRSILKEKTNVFAVGAPSVALKILKNESVDIIITDFMLPEMNGLQVLEKVKQEYPEIEVIMISNKGDMDTVIDALRKGAADFFKKPFTASELWVAIERTRRYSELYTNLNQYKKKTSALQAEINQTIGCDIIGETTEIKDIKKQMQLVAQTPDTSVLVLGESGTGKELIARGIHNLSSRKEEFFGAVNMSAVPETLFESEFFGHKKGSFTGAIADKAGWFETANKGTLFFDEIGEMSMSLQVKLLRVLEDRKFTKVGTQKEQQFDIRIITATNKTVEEITDGKNFRLDLFYRLGTFIIQLPPLNKRTEDIPILADYFLSGTAKKMGKTIQGISASAVELLNAYSFPGNIRELKNIIERAVILCDEKELKPKHLLLNTIGNKKLTESNSDNSTYDLKELEKQTIIKALKKVNYNKAEAARLLNLEWNALYRRIEKHGIELL